MEGEGLLLLTSVSALRSSASRSHTITGRRAPPASVGHQISTGISPYSTTGRKLTLYYYVQRGEGSRKRESDSQENCSLARAGEGGKAQDNYFLMGVLAHRKTRHGLKKKNQLKTRRLEGADTYLKNKRIQRTRRSGAESFEEIVYFFIPLSNTNNCTIKKEFLVL
jgi:hypothetical protein